MSEKLKAKNISTAIKRLPDAKTYGAEIINVSVERITYTFEKINKEWYYKF